LISALFDGGADRCIIVFPTRGGSEEIVETVTVEANWALKTGRRLSHHLVARAVTAEMLTLPDGTVLQFSAFQHFRTFFSAAAEPVSAQVRWKGRVMAVLEETNQCGARGASGICFEELFSAAAEPVKTALPSCPVSSVPVLPREVQLLVFAVQPSETGKS
jgi:hypothetical protein